MKKTITCILILCGALQGFGQSKDIAIVKKLNSDWIGSYVTKDTALMRNIFADDLILINPEGKEFRKKQILTSMASPGLKFLSIKVDTVSVRIIGKIALVNAQITAVSKANNVISTVQTNYLDVYEKRNGRWQAIAAHVTLLSAK